MIMERMDCFVIMYNRLTWPRRMCEILSEAGLNVVLIDNMSTYPPLLEWYLDCPYEIYRLGRNLGHKALYTSGILDERGCGKYILTDHDLDLSGVPMDFPEMLEEGLESNPHVRKAGLSLEIDDLPDNLFTREVRQWEGNYWRRQTDNRGFFFSEVDTTLAYYDRSREHAGFPSGDEFFSAVRSPRPYTARHLPWYNTPENITPEEEYYMRSTNTYWSGRYKENLMK